MISMQIWFIGRTLASQAGKAGSTPVICLFLCPYIYWINSSFPCKYKDFRFSMWIFDINNLQSSRRIGAAWAQIPPSSVIQNLPLQVDMGSPHSLLSQMLNLCRLDNHLLGQTVDSIHAPLHFIHTVLQRSNLVAIPFQSNLYFQAVSPFSPLSSDLG